jgi:internalin A
LKISLHWKELYCYNNQLTTLKGIENLTNLHTLYCDNNQLTSLKGIENLTYLKKLYYSNNQLPYKTNILGDILKEIKKEKRKRNYNNF